MTTRQYFIGGSRGVTYIEEPSRDSSVPEGFTSLQAVPAAALDTRQYDVGYVYGSEHVVYSGKQDFRLNETYISFPPVKDYTVTGVRQYFIGGIRGLGYVVDTEKRDFSSFEGYVSVLTDLGIDAVWNLGIWNVDYWERGTIDVSASVTNPALLTTSVGTVTVSIGATINVTNPALLTTSVGTVTVTGKTNVSVTNPAALTVSYGTVTVTGKASVTVTNPALLTVSVGTPTVSGKAVVSVSGLSVTAAVGSATVNLSSNVQVPVTTPTLTASVGTVSVTAKQFVSVPVTNPALLTASVGPPSVSVKTTVNVSGLSVAASNGLVTVSGGAQVAVVNPALLTVSVGTVSITAKQYVSVPVTNPALLTVSLGTVSITARQNITAPVTNPALLTVSVGTVGVTTYQNVDVPVVSPSLTASVDTATVEIDVTSEVAGFELSTYTPYVAAGGEPPGDAWDWQRTKPFSIILSDNDKTATAPVGVTGEIWSTTEHIDGKVYVEVIFGGSTPTEGVGLFEETLSDGIYLHVNGTVETFEDGLSIGSVPVFPSLESGDIVDIALDTNISKVWFRLNGGDWNNDPTQGPS